MTRFAICNEVFGASQNMGDWRRVCEFVAAQGYEGIEVAPFTFAASVEDINAAARRELRGIAHGCGLEICALHWLLVSPPGLHLHSKERAVRRRTEDYLKSLNKTIATTSLQSRDRVEPGPLVGGSKNDVA